MILAYHKSDELYHHGILGQEWGKRNGPPYPLDAGDHSAAEKKSGWRKSLGSGKIVGHRKKAGKAEVKKSNDRKSGFLVPAATIALTNSHSRKMINDAVERGLAIRRAKNEDKWDMDFLEYTQNEDYANSKDQKSKDKMLKEYESYLENPDKWIKNLRQQQEERAARNRALNEHRTSGKIGDRGDILSETDEKRATKFMNDIERNGQELINEIFGGKNNTKYPNREAMADRAAALKKQGLTNEQIAKKLGYDSASAVSSLLKDKNVKVPDSNRTSGSQMQLFRQQDNAEARKSASAQNPNYNISYDDKNENLAEARRQVIDLRKKGYTTNEIKEIMGLTKSDDVHKISEYTPTSDKGAEKRYNISRGYTTVKDAKKNKHDYSTEDLKDIVARYNAEESINAAVKEINDAKKKKVLNTIKKVTEVSSTVYDAANSIDKWAKLLSPSDDNKKKK